MHLEVNMKISIQREKRMSNKEYFHNYYLAHKNSHIAKSKEYYNTHKAEILAYRKITKPYATPKMKAYYKEYAKNHPNPKGKFKSLLKCQYNLSLDQYNELVVKQNNLCLICNNPETHKPRLSIDHHHETGRVRGLLCHNCNAGLGHFKDSIEVLQSAINYIKDK